MPGHPFWTVLDAVPRLDRICVLPVHPATVSIALKLWNGWKVNPDDIEFVRKRNGNPKSLGCGPQGTRLRDANGGIIAGEFKKVAVKEFKVKTAEEKQQLGLFIREVFLQMDAKHDCIVETLGGYWPDAEEVEDGDYIEPCIVMELMTPNLRQVLGMQLLNTPETNVFFGTFPPA